MTQYVGNAWIIPQFLETPNKGTVHVLVANMRILRIASAPRPPPFDPRTRSVVMQAQNAHITGVLGLARETHSDKSNALEISTVMRDILHYRIDWRVATVKS